MDIFVAFFIAVFAGLGVMHSMYALDDRSGILASVLGGLTTLVVFAEVLSALTQQC